MTKVYVVGDELAYLLSMLQDLGFSCTLISELEAAWQICPDEAAVIVMQPNNRISQARLAELPIPAVLIGHFSEIWSWDEDVPTIRWMTSPVESRQLGTAIHQLRVVMMSDRLSVI